MKVGDLVKITRASIGVPLYTRGLIIKTQKVENTPPFTDELTYHHVQLCTVPERIVRRLPRDLETLNASR